MVMKKIDKDTIIEKFKKITRFNYLYSSNPDGKQRLYHFQEGIFTFGDMKKYVWIYTKKPKLYSK